MLAAHIWMTSWEQLGYIMLDTQGVPKKKKKSPAASVGISQPMRASQNRGSLNEPGYDSRDAKH